MPDTNLPVEAATEVAKSIARLEKIERTRKTTPPAFFSPLIFSYSGDLDVNVESPPMYPESVTLLVQIRVSILEAAVGDNTVEVRVGGNPIQQFTLSAGDMTMTAACSIPVTPGDPLTVKTIAASGSDLSVIFRNRAR